MIFTTILTINKHEIKNILEHYDAQKLDTVVTTFKEFDIPAGEKFIPPIYNSKAFNRIFNKVSTLTSFGLALHTQSYHLILRTQENKFQINLLSTVDAYESISLKITELQYKNLLKALHAGGMKLSYDLERKVETYLYLPSHTVYSLYSWSGLPPFLYVRSPNQIRLVEGLSIIGFSLDRVSQLTFEEVHKLYNIPSLFLL